MAPNFTQRIKPVDPERFRFALGVFLAAAAMKGPYTNPQEFGINLLDDDGSVHRLSFTDRPENRGMLAVKREFSDPNEFQAIGFRIMTFPEIIKNKQIISWGLIRKGENGQDEIHDCVVTALAQVPFRKSGRIDRKAFLELVKNGIKEIRKIVVANGKRITEMTKNLTRPERWNSSIERAIGALNEFDALKFRLIAELEELEDQWNEIRQRFGEALSELMQLQGEYEAMEVPENLYESRFREKLDEVKDFEFGVMKEKVPDLRKMFEPLEKFKRMGCRRLFRYLCC